MKNHFFKIAVFTLPLLILSFTNKQLNPEHHPKKIYKAKHHIIVVLDGPRWSETWGDSTYELIPNQAHILKQQGTFFSNFRNRGVTLTNPGHTAICTGVYQRMSNTGEDLPKKPSIMQYYLKQSGVDKRKAWVLTSKGKLQVLSNTKENNWWNKYNPSSYCGKNGLGVGYPADRVMYPKFKSIILENDPTIAVINLLGIDSWAHQGSWEKYRAAIKELDGYVLDLWNAIQNDPEMKGETALYITNDHGRHLDGVKSGFTNHGCKCDGCTHISLLALGPDFQKNKVVSEEYSQKDISATIALMLGIKMPTSEGCPIPPLVDNDVN